MSQIKAEQDRIDEERVAVLTRKTEAERLQIAWGMGRSARKMLERVVAFENREPSPDEQRRIIASRISHGT